MCCLILCAFAKFYLWGDIKYNSPLYRSFIIEGKEDDSSGTYQELKNKNTDATWWYLNEKNLYLDYELSSCVWLLVWSNWESVYEKSSLVDVYVRGCCKL